MSKIAIGRCTYRAVEPDTRIQRRGQASREFAEVQPPEQTFRFSPPPTDHYPSVRSFKRRLPRCDRRWPDTLDEALVKLHQPPSTGAARGSPSPSWEIDEDPPGVLDLSSRLLPTPARAISRGCVIQLVAFPPLASFRSSSLIFTAPASPRSHLVSRFQRASRERNSRRDHIFAAGRVG